MALAVALQPDLLIADEPTTALDVTIQRVVIQNLAELREKFGLTMVVITHDMGVHAQLVDRVAMMYQGKVVEVGDVRQMFKAPSARVHDAADQFHPDPRSRPGQEGYRRRLPWRRAEQPKLIGLDERYADLPWTRRHEAARRQQCLVRTEVSAGRDHQPGRCQREREEHGGPHFARACKSRRRAGRRTAGRIFRSCRALSTGPSGLTSSPCSRILTPFSIPSTK